MLVGQPSLLRCPARWSSGEFVDRGLRSILLLRQNVERSQRNIALISPIISVFVWSLITHGENYAGSASNYPTAWAYDTSGWERSGKPASAGAPSNSTSN
ncbi:MAG: hypothetical protein DMG96_38325 [Acidobacteria bacterium]|nr:MAG: hypothetical protein DMG96_38325 [Acidobacteriota bacterium]